MRTISCFFVGFFLSLLLLLTVAVRQISIHLGDFVEVHKDVRNELQDLNVTISNRIQCVSDLLEGTCEIKLNKVAK